MKTFFIVIGLCIAVTISITGDIFGQSKNEAGTQETDSKQKEIESDNKLSNPTVEGQQDGLYWIFLTTGKSTAGVDKEKIDEMQQQHLANFKRLADEGTLLSAGPMSDPGKKLRGIVVLRAKNENTLAAMFEPDPYVQSGYLNVEATKMTVDHGAINTRITPQGMEEYRIVVVERANESIDEKSAGTVEQSRRYITELSSDEALLLTVSLEGSDCGRNLIMIMNKPESDDLIREKLQEIPAIKAGVWKSQVMPLYLGKGTLKTS